MWVAPFGNLRVNGYLLLTAAYRSLSRPSSAPDAKAFPLRSFQLDLLVAKSIPLRFRRQPKGFRRKLRFIPLLLAFAKNWFLAIRGTGNDGQRRGFTEIAILMNYAGFTKKFFEIVIVTLHPFGCCSTIKTYASHFSVLASLLPYFAFITLFSFQGAELPASFEARSQNPKPFGF